VYNYTSFAIWKPRRVIIHTLYTYEYTITHLRCVRLQTIGCVKLHIFVLHTFYLSKMCYFTQLLRKNTPLLITLFNPTHLSHFYTPFGYTDLSQFYTPFEYTHLSMLHTFWIYTPFPILHTFWIYTPFPILHTFWIYTPFDRIITVYCMQAFFTRYIKSINSVYLGVQPCLCVFGVHI
jgi:hypothetical protein